MFRMLKNQGEVCCWKRDDLRESEGGGYHVKGEGGRGRVEGGEGGGKGEGEGLERRGLRGRGMFSATCVVSGNACQIVSASIKFSRRVGPYNVREREGKGVLCTFKKLL